MTHRFLTLTRSSDSVPLSALFQPSSRDRNEASRRTDALTVRFGQRTFDAEGTEVHGPFFSRRISYPPFGDSGVTIGRGYDMGRRTAAQIISELTAAGMLAADARYLSQSAGLRREKAREFVKLHRMSAPLMPLETQKQLFEDIITPDMVGDIKRIFSKPDTIKTYGEAHWEKLPRAVQELIFDLRYRGDYTPSTRRRLQAPLVSGDLRALRAVIDDTPFWSARGVPPERIRERQSLVAQW